LALSQSSDKESPMRKLLIATAAALACAAPALAQQKPSVGGESAVVTSPGKGSAARVVTITASVESVDPAERTVTLKGPRGRVVTLPVSEKVKNFDKIKVGDMVAVRYLEALSLELKKNGTGIRERSEREGSETAKPGGCAARSRPWTCGSGIRSSSSSSRSATRWKRPIPKPLPFQWSRRLK
jgi:hypothetical protein